MHLPLRALRAGGDREGGKAEGQFMNCPNLMKNLCQSAQSVDYLRSRPRVRATHAHHDENNLRKDHL